MYHATVAALTAPCDLGHASVDPDEIVGANEYGVSPHASAWGTESLKLHIGWLNAQLAADPRDAFKLGRRDAMHDLLGAKEPVSS